MLYVNKNSRIFHKEDFFYININVRETLKSLHFFITQSFFITQI